MFGTVRKGLGSLDITFDTLQWGGDWAVGLRQYILIPPYVTGHQCSSPWHGTAVKQLFVGGILSLFTSE